MRARQVTHRLNVRSAPPCEVLSEGAFFRTVRGGFARRRKTACNALSAAWPQLGKQGVGEALLACGHDPSVRCETFTIPQFAALSNELYRRTQNV
jgi:16S rRNA (adenine1518-N6/adenine1519-N6)-dimethyltransferase